MSEGGPPPGGGGPALTHETLGALTDRIGLPGIQATPYEQGQGGHPFDVQITIRENGPAVDGELHHPADLLTESAATRLASSFVEFVQTVTAHPPAFSA